MRILYEFKGNEGSEIYIDIDSLNVTIGTVDEVKDEIEEQRICLTRGDFAKIVKFYTVGRQCED